MLQKLKIISVGFGLIIFLLGMLSVLQFFRFQNLLYDVVSSRVEVPAEALKRDIERSIATGLTIQTNSQLSNMLNEVVQKNSIVFSIQIQDSLSNSNEPLWIAGAMPGPTKCLDDESRAKDQGPAKLCDAPVFTQRWPIVDPIGKTVAQLIFISDKSEVLKLSAGARKDLARLFGILCASSMAILFPLLFYLLISLDKIILAARSVILGNKVDQSVLAHSELCQLAQNVQDVKNATLTLQQSSAKI
jgi:hypothetical protein